MKWDSDKMKKDKVLVGVFLFIVFGVFIFLPIKFVMIKLGIVAEKSNDNWTTVVLKEEHNVFDKVENKFSSLKNSLENRVTNYFPGYNSLNTLYQNANFATNKLVFKEEVPLKVNSDGEYVFYNKKNDFFYLRNKYSNVDLENRLDKQVEFFNFLEQKGLDVYLYVPTRYELTTLASNNINAYINDFKGKLNQNIGFRSMEIKDVDEYKKMFYRTDHHWTMNGALQGYYDIMEMLGKNPIANLEVKEVRDRKYYGSLAKSIMNDQLNDYISDVTVNLQYDVLVNGDKKPELFKPREIRLDRSYKYYDYYVQYFNGQYGNVIYDFHNENEENLLIMSDSYAWQIDYLIAASFNKTHVINLRYDEYKNKEFEISKYMEENDIDKVLFLYQGESILFDAYDYDFIGRVK